MWPFAEDDDHDHDNDNDDDHDDGILGRDDDRDDDDDDDDLGCACLGGVEHGAFCTGFVYTVVVALGSSGSSSCSSSDWVVA